MNRRKIEMNELLKNVKSSNIEQIGYNEGLETLYVKYKSGKVYAYDKVPKQIYEGLEKAESKGSYMNSQIKNKFSFKTI